MIKNIIYNDHIDSQKKKRNILANIPLITLSDSIGVCAISCILLQISLLFGYYRAFLVKISVFYIAYSLKLKTKPMDK